MLAVAEMPWWARILPEWLTWHRTNMETAESARLRAELRAEAADQRRLAAGIMGIVERPDGQDGQGGQA